MNEKRPAAYTAGHALRHIGDIVIWEGNYKSDILIIGENYRHLMKNKKIFEKSGSKLEAGIAYRFLPHRYNRVRLLG
jgi:hypothetical protein